MRLDRLEIANYKSLRAIALSPGPLTLIVGPNTAGKSNFADCLDFLSEVYRHGLDLAVSRKGGYENIAFRRIRRSKQPVAIRTVATLDVARPDDDQSALLQTRFCHHFAFQARGYSIRAEFKILSEDIRVEALVDDSWRPLVEVKRAEDNKITAKSHLKDFPARSRATHQLHLWADDADLGALTKAGRPFPSTELIATSVGPFAFPFRSFTRELAGMRVFQIQPSKARSFGVPTPRPELELQGANLPAVVDLLKRRRGRAWSEILSVMRALMPSLKDISVDYTSNRTLELLFSEDGFGRPWNVAEISDGTVQALALLVALFDDRSSALVIDELENSLHPWIIRRLIDACKVAAEQKQIILTSHSPIVIDEMPPEAVYVLWREGGASHLSPLAGLDPAFLDMWKRGDVSTFEYLDSGAETKAIPPV